MEIVKNHFTPSRKVSRYSEIASEVNEMIMLLDPGIKKGEYEKGYGLSHCQVSNDPLAFFVIASAYVGEGKMWPHQVIINPQILEASDKIVIGKNPDGTDDVRQNIRTYPEGCFSFPFRKPKNMRRYYQIKVRYQIPVEHWSILKLRFETKLDTIEEEIEGLRAHIYQHEWQHAIGENIYIPKK